MSETKIETKPGEKEFDPKVFSLIADSLNHVKRHGFPSGTYELRIAMHPDLFFKMADFNRKNLNGWINAVNDPGIFGVKIIRSMDLAPEKFEILVKAL